VFKKRQISVLKFQLQKICKKNIAFLSASLEFPIISKLDVLQNLCFRIHHNIFI